MRHKVTAFVIAFILIGLCAWSPWINQETASRLAESRFNQAWDGVMDGCGTFGEELGAKGFRKIPFSAVVTLDYQCGLVAPDELPLHTTIYVTFLGTTFGYPKP